MDKSHIEYGDEMDIIIDHQRHLMHIDKNIGDFLGTGIQMFSYGGAIYRKILGDILIDFHINRNYYLIETPMVASTELYKLSGHIDFYRENMYIFKIEDKEYAIKPMNCPHHILSVINLLEKYRKIPIPFRTFELGRVHRYEASGNVYGLLRLRNFTQDDSHIFVQFEHVTDEILKVLEELIELYENLFAISKDNIKLRLSLSDPEKIGKEYIGTKEEWEQVEEFYRKAADKIKQKYNINYIEARGEAAFYGPKFDFIIEEMGKNGQVGTIQFDFNLPRRFKLNEIFRDILGIEDIYIIHRALLGSLERFTGAYLETRKGRLPFVLNPIQVTIVAIFTGNKEIDDKINKKAIELYNQLKDNQIRVIKVDTDKVGLSNKVRLLESSLKPSVYIYLGEKEIQNNKLSIKYFDIYKNSYENYDGDILNLIDKLEEGVYRLNKKKYRLFEDLGFMA